MSRRRPAGADTAGAVDDELLSRQSFHLMVVVIATIVGGGVGVVLLGNLDVGQLSPGYPVALAGTVGGTINTFRRLQRLQRTDLQERPELVPRLAIAQIYLSPLIGAVFALVAYGLFLSGLVRGEFFPDFACSSADFVGYGEFSLCAPATNADMAAAMVWAFVAGFGERFVPNLLDGLPGGRQPDEH